MNGTEVVRAIALGTMNADDVMRDARIEMLEWQVIELTNMVNSLLASYQVLLHQLTLAYMPTGTPN